MVPRRLFAFLKSSTTTLTIVMLLTCQLTTKHKRAGLLFMVAADPSGSCPLSSVSRCFSTVYSNHRHSKTSQPLDLSVPSVSSCRIFEPFENCFAYVQCTDVELSQVAALEYFKMFQVFIPKEAATAFRANLRQKCQPHCVRNAEYKCRLEMKGEARDKDNALVLELHALKLQLMLRVTDPKEGCPRLELIMARISYHRKHNCKSESMWCLCKQAKDKLRGVCPVNCAVFDKGMSSGAIRTYGINGAAPKRRLVIVIDILALTVITIFVVKF